MSSYAAVPAGTWTMSATGSSGQAGLPVTLAGSTVHTEVVPGGTAPILWLTVIGAGLLLAVTGGTGLGRGRLRRLTTGA